MRFPECPRPIRIRGRGVFRCGESCVECCFVIIRHPHGNWIQMHGNAAWKFSACRDIWTLEGTLSDGRAVCCEGLFVTDTVFGTEGGSCRLFANKPIHLGIGLAEPPVQVCYPLIGYFDGAGQIEYAGWSITLDDMPDKAAKDAAKTYSTWRLPVEGMNLTLANQTASLEHHNTLARMVTRLLSLACGTGVTCQREIAMWADDSKLETLGHWPGDTIGPGACVPSWEIARFLGEALPIWDGWSEDKRGLAYLAIAYVNASGSGYLDSKLLSIMQAWELLANGWVDEPALTAAEECLLRRVRAAYKAWKKDDHGNDTSGVLMDRLARGFRWPPILTKMHALADGVDLAKIDLDLGALKSIRDRVAHDGCLPDNVAQDRPSAVATLKAAQFGLQLVLLRELGYTGLVKTANSNGWSVFPPIAEFLKHTDCS